MQEVYLIWNSEGLFSHAKSFEEARQIVSDAICELSQNHNISFDSARRYVNFKIEKKMVSDDFIEYLES